MFFIILGTYTRWTFIIFSLVQRILLLIFQCHTVTLLVFPQKIFISDQVLSKFDSNVQSNAEIYVADGILFIFKHSISLNVWKCPVLLLCHTVTIYFSQHIS